MTLPKHPKPTTPVTHRTMDAFEMHNALLRYVIWIDATLEEMGKELGRYEMMRVTTKLTKDKAECMHKINKLAEVILIDSEPMVSELKRDETLIIN